MWYLFISRCFLNDHQILYIARRYARELDEECLDVMQNQNTCTKIITLAQIQEREDEDHISLEELEESVPERMREKNRLLLCRMDVPSKIYRNVEYHGKSERVVRAGMEALSILCQTKEVVTMLRYHGYHDERLYYRRVNKIPGPELGLYKPKQKKGLSGMVQNLKSDPDYVKLHTDAEEDSDGDENISEAYKETKRAVRVTESLEETEDALELRKERDYSPDLPLKLLVWSYRFRHNDHVHKCCLRFSNAFRGLYQPDETVAFLQSQIKSHYNLPEDIVYDEGTAIENREDNRRKRARSSKNKRSKVVKRGSKYVVEMSDPPVPKPRRKKFGLPYEANEKVEVKAFSWWPRYYPGAIAKAMPNAATSTSEGGVYVVELDDGEVIANVEAHQLRKPCPPPFRATEHLKALLSLLGHHRWILNPDFAQDAVYTLFLMVQCGNDDCGHVAAMEAGCLGSIMNLVRLHPYHAYVQVRCMHVLDELSRHSPECNKSVAKCGAIRDIMENLKGIKFEDDAQGTVDAQKAALWCVDSLVQIRSHVEEMEAHGGQYILTAAERHRELIMTRKVKLVDWKTLRQKRLLGGDDDELQQLEWLKRLFVPCVHMLHVGKGECNDPRHCKQCFVNFHAQGFWHRKGCDKHAENENIPTLLEMTQLRRQMEQFDPNPQAKRPEIPLMDYSSTKLKLKSPAQSPQKLADPESPAVPAV